MQMPSTKIALSGKFFSGKTTACEYIREHYLKDAQHLKFAQPIYDVAHNVCKMPHGEENKDRNLLQQLGTAMKVSRPNLFAELLVERAAEYHQILVDDLRFPGELKALKDGGFYTIRLEIDPELQEERIRALHPEPPKERDMWVHKDAENHTKYRDMVSALRASCDLILEGHPTGPLQFMCHSVDKECFPETLEPLEPVEKCPDERAYKRIKIKEPSVAEKHLERRGHRSETALDDKLDEFDFVIHVSNDIEAFHKKLDEVYAAIRGQIMQHVENSSN